MAFLTCAVSGLPVNVSLVLRALIQLGIDRNMPGLRRNAHPGRLVVDDRMLVTSVINRRPCLSPSSPARKARGNIAVDVDQRLQLRRIRIELYFDGPLHYEQSKVGDILPDFQRLGIIVGFGSTHED